MDNGLNWRYCAVGNITKTHIDKDGILRYGSSAFTGGTKVYLCGKYWNAAHEKICVIGLSRGKQYQAVDLTPDLIEHVRCQHVFKPSVLKLMDDLEFCDCWWGKSKRSKQAVEAFVAQWNQQTSAACSAAEPVRDTETGHLVKIQAIRKICYPDLMAKYENPIANACDVEEGQCWYSENGQKPDEFCDSAWQTLAPFVQELAQGGGNFYDGWMKDPQAAMLSCNDGFRPVSFYIEVVRREDISATE